MPTITKQSVETPVIPQGNAIPRIGVRAEASGSIAAFEAKNGKFGPYEVAPVESYDEYETKLHKKGIIHITNNTKHPWSEGQLSAAADEGKVSFITPTGTIAKVGEPYVQVVLPEKMGRSETGQMLT